MGRTASSDQPFAAPEISESQKYERAQHEPGEVESPRKAQTALGIAERLRHFCDQVPLSFIQRVGICHRFITSKLPAADGRVLLAFVVNGIAANGYILSILKKWKTKDYLLTESKSQSQQSASH